MKQRFLSYLVVAAGVGTLALGKVSVSGNSQGELTNSEIYSLYAPIYKSTGKYKVSKGGQSKVRLSAIDGTKLTPETTRAVLKTINSAFQRKGIFGTRVVVTREGYNDALSTGNLRVKINEAKIKGVQFSSSDQSKELWNGTEKRIKKALGGVEQFESGKMNFKPASLRKNLNLVNRHPRRFVEPFMKLAPGGGLIVDYRVRELAPHQLQLFVDTYGAKATGETRFGAMYSGYNYLGLDEEYVANFTTASEGNSYGGLVKTTVPLDYLGKHKMGVHANYSAYALSDLGIDAGLPVLPQGNQVTGSTIGAGWNYKYNFFDNNKSLFLDASLGIDWMRVASDRSVFGGVDGDLLDVETDYLLPSLTFSAQDYSSMKWWNLMGSFKMNLPDVAGTAEDEGSNLELSRFGRFGAENEFTIFNLSGSYGGYLDTLLGLDNRRGQQLDFRFNGVYNLSGNRLPANFLTTLGGGASLRGYPVAAISGDNAVFASLNYKLHLPRLIGTGLNSPTDSQRASKEADGRDFRYRPRFLGDLTDWNMTPGVFFDFGKTWVNDKLLTEEDEMLMSTGLSCDITYRKNFSIQASVGFPLEETTVGFNEVVEAWTPKFDLAMRLKF